MARVFVIQKQMQQNRETGEFVERFNLSPAKEYGEVIYLLSPTAAPWKPDKVLQELELALHDFGPDDFLLLIGNPVLIGLASAIAASKVDTVTFLQWSGRDQRYMPIRANINLSIA